MVHLIVFDWQSIEKFVHEFEEIFYTGDTIAMAAYYTKDAALIGEGIGTIRGRQNIEAFWQITCESAKKLNMRRSIILDSIEISDNISYAISTLSLQFQTPDGKTIDKTVKDVTIWRRQTNGVWQIEMDISTPIH